MSLPQKTPLQMSRADQWLGDCRKDLPGLVTPSNGGAGIGKADGSDAYKTKWLRNSVFLLNPQLLPGQNKHSKAEYTPYQPFDGVQNKGDNMNEAEWKSQASKTVKRLPIRIHSLFSPLLWGFGGRWSHNIFLQPLYFQSSKQPMTHF